MGNQDLLRSQKNEVFRLVEKVGLTPSEFEWSMCEEQTGKADKSSFDFEKIFGDIFTNALPKLIHIPTGYYFSFGSLISSKFYIEYFPSAQQAKKTWVETDGSWRNTISTLEKWLGIVLREHFEPDLWLTNDKALVTEDLSEFENSSFSSDEQVRISKAIVELKSFLLTTQQHSPAHIQFIEERLEHLDESSKRLGRKDWITLAMGTLTNIIVGVALAPDAAREFVRNAGVLLGWIVGSVHLPP